MFLCLFWSPLSILEMKRSALAFSKIGPLILQDGEGEGPRKPSQSCDFAHLVFGPFSCLRSLPLSSRSCRLVVRVGLQLRRVPRIVIEWEGGPAVR